MHNAVFGMQQAHDSHSEHVVGVVHDHGLNVVSGGMHEGVHVQGVQVHVQRERLRLPSTPVLAQRGGAQGELDDPDGALISESD